MSTELLQRKVITNKKRYICSRCLEYSQEKFETLLPDHRQHKEVNLCLLLHEDNVVLEAAAAAAVGNQG